VPVLVNVEAFDLAPGDEFAELRIPLKSAADSERSRPPVPIEAGRGFR